MEALKRYRTGGEQTVTVQHVNVGEGGQAIVGNLTQEGVVPSRMPAQALALTHDQNLPMPIIESEKRAEVRVPRNRAKNDGGPSAQYRADALELALRRQDPLRRVLPIARGPG